jgi:ribonuclease P/MRP protein subunit POP1
MPGHNGPTRARAFGREATSSGFGARSLDVVDFVGARVSELRALRVAASAKSGNRRVYQQLSWHERRRTMSHASHRMPARLRQVHRRELGICAAPGQTVKSNDGGVIEKSPGPQGKMQCRKYRRRAAFLPALRKLRAQCPRWLETHIWHAKRFHMDAIGGNRTVAMFPNDRGLRSGYRALSHACLGHDASYLDVIEIASDAVGAIFAAMAVCFESEDCARATTDPVVAGIRRAERLVVLDADGYALGPVDVLWRPAKRPQVWLWSHPAASSAIVTAFQAAHKAGTISVAILRDQLLTYTLLGPRAGSILGAVFHRVRHGGVEWECIKGVRNPASMPPDAVVALEVEDPRASFPPKRVAEGGRMIPGKHVSAVLAGGFGYVRDSRIWSHKERCTIRSQAKHEDGASFDYIPVLCMQRSAGLSRGFGSGWDIVLPAGWGMPFWVSLMYANGGRAAGQRELHYVALEAGLPAFPEDYQDTIPGQSAMAMFEERNRDAHGRRPKSKRVDFGKYRIRDPFSANLPGLIRREEPPSVSLRNALAIADTEGGGPRGGAKDDQPRARILRSRRAVREALKIGAVSTALETIDGQEPRGRYKVLDADKVRDDIVLDSSLDACLLQAILRPCGKGTPLQNAIVCIPTAEDMNQSRRDRRYSGAVEALAPRSELRVGCEASRKVVGRVVNGDYSLVRGRGIGNCVITVRGVLELISQGADSNGRKGGTRPGERVKNKEFLQLRVLFRNIRSLQYRAAVATIRLG